MNEHAARVNDAIFQVLQQPSPLGEAASQAVVNYTREKMYRLHHIPAKYFLGWPGLAPLAHELAAKGYIDLDNQGEPCCLSGQPAMFTGGGSNETT